MSRAEERVRAVLAEAGRRSEELAELFARPLAAAGWGSGVRTRTLEELVAVETARLQGDPPAELRRQHLVELLGLLAVWEVLRELDEERPAEEPEAESSDATELEALRRRTLDAREAMSQERARRG